MSNFNIRIVGTANLTQQQKAFAQLEAQVAAYNAELEKTAIAANGVNPAGFERMQRMVAQNSKTFRNAAASTGMWHTEQIRAASATDTYTRALEKQKLSFRDLAKNAGVAKAAYKEQLALQNMVVRALPGKRNGKQLFDLAIPTDVHKDLDTIGNRIGWIREQTRSAATQMVNWGKNTQWAGRQLMVGFTLPMAALGAAAGVMAYKVDKEMTRVKKVYDTTANQASTRMDDIKAVQEEFAALQAASFATAADAAGKYGTTMDQTLSVQADLAATGQRGAKLQSATTEVVKNAMLGEIDYQTATKTTIALQQQLHLSSSQLADTWAYMNSVENSTSLQMKDFAAAIPIALGPIRQMGGDVKDLGILMTGLVSRGVEVGKAANAIKALPQRLLRPSAQVQKEFADLTGGDIKGIATKNKGNAIGMLTDIYDITKKLSKLDKSKVFAGLFGSFQLSTMSAMVASMGDLENGVGQVSKAMEIGNQDASQWRQVQEQEIGQWQNSISGKFKTAVAEIQVQLVEMGKPFLQVATVAIKAISGILKYFNNLPKGAKIFLAVGASLLAIAGPLVMITGLFANFAGNILKFGVSITGVLGKMEILNAESAAVKISAALAQEGFMMTGTAAQRTEAALLGMNAALAEANMLQRQSSLNPAAAAGTRALLPIVSAPGPAATAAATKGGIGQNFKGVGAGLGVAAAAMTVMAVQSNKTADNISKWVMYAALFGPAMIGVVTTLKNAPWGAIGTAIKDKMAVGSGSLLTNVKGSLAGLVGMVNPVGLTVAALGAGAIALYAWWKHGEKIKQQQKDEQKAIQQSTSLWAQQLNLRKRGLKELATASATAEAGAPSIGEAAKNLMKTDTGKNLVSGFKAAGASEQDVIAQQQYIAILRETNGSAEDARRALEIMYVAAGDGALDAQMKAEKFYTTIGSTVEQAELGKLWGDEIKVALDGTEAALDERGKALGQRLGDAIASAQGSGQKKSIMAGFANQLTDSWTEVMSKFPDTIKAQLDQLKITTGKQLLAFTSGGAPTPQAANLSDYEAENLRGRIRQQVLLNGQSKNLAELERRIAGALGEQLNIKEKITSMSQLQNTWEWKLYTVNKNNAKQLLQQRLHQKKLAETSFLFTKGAEGTTEQSKLQILNQIRLSLGYKETGRYADLLGKRTMDVNGNIIESVASATKLKGAFDQAKYAAAGIKLDQIAGALHDARTSYQQEIADASTKYLDNQANAAMAATQAAGERREKAFERQQEKAAQALEYRQQDAADAFSRRQENQTRALDDRQKRRAKSVSNAFDARIKKVNDEIKAEQKADDIRQKLFDAEMTRIDRLNESQNATVDFNMALNAGNLDEAAKIRNDMNAKVMEYALTDANNAAGNRSQNSQERKQARVDALEKQKDKAIENLGKVEEAEKRSLERRQQREKKYFDRRQKREADGLKRQQEREKAAVSASVARNNKAEETKWQARKDALANSLKDFMGYVGVTNSDLRKHIKSWKAAHKDMVLVTQGRFDASSDHVEKYLHDRVIQAAREITNANVWETSGSDIAKDMINGAFGLSVPQFRKWMLTGVYPKKNKGGDGKKPGKTTAPGGSSAQSKNTKMFTQHVGGWAGETNSRAGVARTAASHPSEVMVRAQRGEYIVNRDAAAKHGGLLESINSGRFGSGSPASRMNRGPANAKGGGGGAATGMAGVMMGMLAAAVKTTIKQGITVGANAAIARSQVGALGAGAPGLYGGRGYNNEQMQNAATIASVGRKMGMSARDIQIGIMTAITESGLVNVRYGDRDSQGLFQQRPSMGWGTVQQVTDPEYAARAFFQHLRGIGDREHLSPWMASQEVQRSAYSDGSNYAPNWDDAKQIFAAMKAVPGGGMDYAAGPGGWHYASVPGKGWVNSHDYRNGMHSPLFAVADGRIIESRAIRSGGSGENAGAYPRGYSSYGVTVVERLNDGTKVRYAHMWPGTNIKTGPVKGGTKIGESAATGNASGPHTHFEINGMENAREWFKAHGIGLESGGYISGNGMANLHQDEVVVDAGRTSDIFDSIDTLSSFADMMRALSQQNLFRTGGSGDFAPEAGLTARDESLKVDGKGGTAGDTVRTGTYNVLHTLPAKAVKGDLAKLMKSADVLSLTEFEGAARTLSDWISEQGWGLQESVGHVADTAVIWNRKMYEKLQGGTRSLNPDVHGTRGQRERFAAYALLRDRDSGREFWQVAAHTTNKASSHKDVQNAQWEGLNNLYNDLKNTGRPVFIAGDLNAPTSRANQIAGGLKSNWSNGTKGQKATFKPHNSFVDHVLTNPLARLLSMNTMGLSSDHRALLTRYGIPSLARGGDIRWDNTLVNTHAGERVLTADLTAKLDAGLSNLASGPSAQYNVKVIMQGNNTTADEVASKVTNSLRRQQNRVAGSRA